MKKNKVELILVPSEASYADQGFLNYSPIPLSIGVLTAYLKKENFIVYGTDLNTKMKKNHLERGANWWGPLFDYNIIMSHLRSGTDTGLESEIDWFLNETNFKDTDIVGIAMGSNMSFFEIHMALLIGKRLQDSYNKTVIFGGANVEYLWQFREVFAELWEVLFKNFSFFILGPGEKTLTAILLDIEENNKSRSYKDLPGTIYYENGNLVHNTEDVPSFICPDFSNLDMEHYKMCCYKEEDERSLQMNLINYYKWPIHLSTKVSERNRRKLLEDKKEEKIFLAYYFNSNCNYKCAFCVQSREGALPPQCKNAKEVVNDLEALIEKYDTKYIRFYNNAFNYSPMFVKEFCNQVIEKKLEFYWSDCARFNNLTKELLELMHKAGCRKLIFGLDSANKKIANLIDKRIDFDQVENVLKWCKYFGIWVEVEVIVGLPYEGEEEFLDTYNFVKSNLEEKLITGFHLNSYYIVPNSLLGKYPEKYGIEIFINSSKGYKKILERNYKMLKMLTVPDDEAIKNPLYSFRFLNFNELSGRKSEVIIKETENKFKRMSQLFVKVSN